MRPAGAMRCGVNDGFRRGQGRQDRQHVPLEAGGHDGIRATGRPFTQSTPVAGRSTVSNLAVLFWSYSCG